MSFNYKIQFMSINIKWSIFIDSFVISNNPTALFPNFMLFILALTIDNINLLNKPSYRLRKQLTKYLNNSIKF
jgi:hypothetical protein